MVNNIVPVWTLILKPEVALFSLIYTDFVMISIVSTSKAPLLYLFKEYTFLSVIYITRKKT